MLTVCTYRKTKTRMYLMKAVQMAMEFHSHEYNFCRLLGMCRASRFAFFNHTDIHRWAKIYARKCDCLHMYNGICSKILFTYQIRFQISISDDCPQRIGNIIFILSFLTAWIKHILLPDLMYLILYNIIMFTQYIHIIQHADKGLCKAYVTINFWKVLNVNLSLVALQWQHNG